MTTKRTGRPRLNIAAIGDDMAIAHKAPRTGSNGTWVKGNVAYPFMWW